MNADVPKAICGAKSRSGEPCKKAPMTGKKRCRNHGGATPSGKNLGTTNGNAKHGLYGAYLSPHEVAAWDDLPLGDVDAEIKMCRVWLARAMALEKATAQPIGHDGTELAEVRHSTSDEIGLTRTDVVNKRPDVAARIDRLLGRLAQLEKTRAELIQAAAERGEGADDKARDVAAALRAMITIETTPVPSDPEPDAEPDDE